MTAKSVRAESNEADLRSAIHNCHRRRHQLARILELARQPLHDVLVLVGLLGVQAAFVVPGAAREVGRLRMIRAGQRALADAVAIHIFVARKSAQPLQIFGGQHLAAISGLSG